MTNEATLLAFHDEHLHPITKKPSAVPTLLIASL